MGGGKHRISVRFAEQDVYVSYVPGRTTGAADERDVWEMEILPEPKCVRLSERLETERLHLAPYTGALSSAKRVSHAPAAPLCPRWSWRFASSNR
jgi:hypothetical protein